MKKRYVDMEQYLYNIQIPKLEEIEKQKCEGLITEEECINVIRNLKKGKTPGLDGITIVLLKILASYKQNNDKLFY